MSSQHVLHEGYSGRNPVPTVQGFREEHAKLQQEAAVRAANGDDDKSLPPTPAVNGAPQKQDAGIMAAPPQDTANGQQKPGSTGESKQEVMAKANANKVKPTDRLKQNKAERTVRDPVTNLDVIVKDAAFSCTLTSQSQCSSWHTNIRRLAYDNDALDPANPKPGPALSPPKAEYVITTVHLSYPRRNLALAENHRPFIQPQIPRSLRIYFSNPTLQKYRLSLSNHSRAHLIN